MKVLWGKDDVFGAPKKTYKTYDNAVKAAENILGETKHRVIIAATADGRFFPVAIGPQAVQDGVQFHMCVAG